MGYRTKPIVAVGRNGEVLSYYESIAEAARMNGFSESAISYAISRGGTSHHIKWMKESDYREMWMNGRTDELSYSYRQMNSDRVRKGWQNASKEKRASRMANISMARKKLVKEHPEVMSATIKSHLQPILCISTGECFESIKAFAEKYGLNRVSATCNIQKGYKVRGLVAKKITKEEYEEYNKRRNQEKDRNDLA